jgi:carbonic anhydrase
MKPTQQEVHLAMTPQKALAKLKEGNSRFLSNLTFNRNTLQLVNATADQQYPFAAILSCSDSRVPVELVFDQGLGDLFSVRLAGNIASIFAIASLEYAVKYLGSRLIVVMGHTSCGAVKGACDDLEDGNIHNILDLIQPAVAAETQTKEERTSENKKFVYNVTVNNVRLQMQQILADSPIIVDMIREETIGMVGGVYDIATGQVEFFEEEVTVLADQTNQKVNEIAD